MMYSDAAYADDAITRYSSMGIAAMLYGAVFFWKATKQRTVTTSSTEAELLALSRGSKELLYWLRFFRNLKLDLEEDSTIYCDNQQTIRLLQNCNNKLETKLKHVDIHQMWLRQEVQAQRVKVEWMPTADMVADGFTKELPALKHAAWVKQLGLMDITDILKKMGR